MLPPTLFGNTRATRSFAITVHQWLRRGEQTNCSPLLKPFFRMDPDGLRRLARHSTIYGWSNFLLVMTRKNEPRCLHRVEVNHAIIFFSRRCFEGSRNSNMEDSVRHFEWSSARRSNPLCGQASLSKRRRIETCQTLWDRDPNPKPFKGYKKYIGKSQPHP